MRGRIRTALVETAERFTKMRRLIGQEEGLRRFAYQDSAGKWTIGIGHLIVLPQEQNLLAYTPTNQAPDSVVNDLFNKDIDRARQAINLLVKVPLTDNQFAALASLIFNIGVGAFSTSTVLSRLNAKDYKGAADAMLLWNKAGGQPVLQARRERERAVFMA